MFFRGVVQRFQSRAQKKVVAVKENDVLAARQRQAQIARNVSAAARIFFRVRELEPPVELRRVIFDNGNAVVG